MDLHRRLTSLGLSLPPAPKPVAAYVPAVQSGDQVWVSGQLPLHDGQLLAAGPVDSVIAIQQARIAARQCALNALSIIDQQLNGDWTRFGRLVRVGVFVASDSTFTDQPQVANGASELLGELLGEAGQHARAAVGVHTLPLGATVELELLAHLG